MAINTAWGEIKVSIGTPGTGDTMSTTLVDIGYILQDSISVEKSDGTAYELRASGGTLVDQMQSDPTFKINLTLIGIEKAKQFWKMNTGKPTAVDSFVNTNKYSVLMASQVVGSDTFEAPVCTISGSPVFTEKEGWTVPLVITVLKGAAGYLFNFGKVA